MRHANKDSLRKPDAALAANLATKAIGICPTSVRRFLTGSSHYVFDVTFVSRPSVVVRMTDPAEASSMVGAAYLNRLLRPLGVPLPAMIVDGSDQPIPYLVLERLSGTDLGNVVHHLDDASLEQIAHKVVDAQTKTAKVPTAGRYGYAVNAEQAPHPVWSDVLHANLDRSRRRIVAIGLFDPQVVDTVSRAVLAAQADLNTLPPTPFLHDTTTKNVIVTDDGTFSGIVDVDDICFGDPRYAAALTWTALIASADSTRYVEKWMRIANYTDDRIFRLYLALFLVDFMSEQGQAFNGNQRPSRPEERESLLRHFSAALREAGA